MLDARKVPSTQFNNSRAVLVPPKTVIKFDTGIDNVVELKPKPAVPSHRVAARQRSTLAREGSSRLENRGNSAESDTSPAVLHRELSGVSLAGSEKRGMEIPEICTSSNVDIGLSGTSLQAFIQHSPSQPKLSLMSPQAQQTAKIAKLRAVEEMSRVTERSRITEQQRQQYMQTALSMDAPRLARSVMKEEREAREEVLNSILGFRQKVEDDNSSNCSNRSMDAWDPDASVSFLTGGELLMLEERKHSRDTHRSSSNDNGKHTADITSNRANKEGSATTTVPAEVPSAVEREDEEQDNSMDQTVRVLKQPSSAEKRQDEEDQRFCKAVEEVERVRKRFIQKASLPVLGSRSNVDKLSSASLDVGSDNGSDQGSVGSSALRPSSASTTHSNTASHAHNSRKAAPAGIGARASDFGLRLRKQASGLFSSVLSRSDSGTPSPLSDPTSSNASAAATPGPVATNAVQVKERARRLSLTLPDAETDPTTAGPFPVLSPSSRGSPMKYIMPTKRQTQLAAEGEVYTVTNNSLSPKPSRLASADSPKVKSLRAPTDNTQTADATDTSSSIGFSEAISPPAPRLSRRNSRNPPSATAPMHPQHGAGTRASQELVASSIDMLIGSRFNSDRNMDVAEEPTQQQQEIMGSSLVLLQQKLESAGAASSSYRNVLSSKQSAASLLHANLNNNANSKVRSNATATALATLNRPNSGGGNANRRNSGIVAATSDNQTGTGQFYSELKTESYDAAVVGEGEGAVPMLHTDDSTSTLGDMFAFHTGEGSRSHPPSSEGLAQGFQKAADKDGATREAQQKQGHRQPAPFRSSYDTDLIADAAAAVVQEHQQGQEQMYRQPQNHGEGDDQNSSTMGDSFFSYSAYLPQSSSGDSSTGSSKHRISLSSAASALHAHPNSGGVHLQPLPITPREPLGEVLGLARPDSAQRSGRRPSSGRGNPHLQPLDVSAVRASQPAVPTAKASETPKDLHYGAQRRQLSAEKRKNSNTNTATSSSSKNHFSVEQASSTGSSGMQPLGLATYTIDESTDQIGTTASASKSSGAFASLGQGKNNGRFSTSSSTRAAQLRQNAQKLMASPLSEWLSVGASLHLPHSLSQSHSHLLAPLSSDSAAQTTDSQDPLATHAPKERRNSSKFTFEDLQQADLRLSLAQLPGPTALSAKKSPRNAATHVPGGESLPTLLPSLASQRPSESLVRSSLYAYTSEGSEDAVQNVYRSLNRLNDHFSQYSSRSHQQSTAGNLSTATVGTMEEGLGPSQRVAAVDQEFDDLLAGTTSGSAAAALITSANQGCTKISMSTQQAEGVVQVADEAQDGHNSETDQEEPFLRRGRPSRHNILVSQSCIDGTPTVLDIKSAPNLSALRRSELAAAADAAAARAAVSSGTTQQQGTAESGPSALSPHLTHEERMAQLRPAQSASALYDRKRAAVTAAAAINASGVSVSTAAAAVSAPIHPRSTANSSSAASPAAHSYNYTGGFSGMILAASSSTQGSPLAGLSPSALHTPVTGRPYLMEGGTSSANRSSGETRSSLSMHTSSTTSTVNMHRHSSRAPSQPLVPEHRLGSLSVNSSTSTSSTALSGMVEGSSPAADPANRPSTNAISASAPQLPLQQQRLGALAAALDAGDAVGNLMAQMMLGKAAHTASGTTLRGAAAGVTGQGSSAVANSSGRKTKH